MSAPRDPAFFDWESPEVGDAIRRILDALEQPAGPEGKARLRALYDLGSAGPEGMMTLLSGFFPILNALLEIADLLPLQADARRTLEQKVYRGIEGMPP